MIMYVCVYVYAFVATKGLKALTRSYKSYNKKYVRNIIYIIEYNLIKYV